MQTPSPKMSAFRNDLGADGQRSGDFEKKFELPQVKREEPEFPIQQNREEQLLIKKEENDFTWSTSEPMKSKDDLDVASRGAELANTSRPQIKEEAEPEFLQRQHMKEEELPIKKEEQDVIRSSGEPSKSEDDLDVASKGAEPAHGTNSTKGWQAENLIAPLSDSDDLLYNGEDDEGVKKKPSGDKLYKCAQCGKTFGKMVNLKRHMVTHTGFRNDFTWSLCEFVKKEDVLGVASGGAEPANTTTLPLIKEEEPEFSQQCKREEQTPFKNEECVNWSTGEPFKSEDDLGVAKRRAEPENLNLAPNYRRGARIPTTVQKRAISNQKRGMCQMVNW
ncbi:uncharacterized protein LOC144213457 isoform X2 [Stigmatopora nigra]